MRLMSVSAIEAYFEGKRQGIRLFAWCKDGEQFVGTCGCTLKEALEEVNCTEGEVLSRYTNAVHSGHGGVLV